VVDEIEALGGRAVANYDSVVSVEGGERMVKAAVDAFGKLDICVNNAGILRDKTLAKLTEDLWDPVVDVHLKGTYCVTRPAYNHMRERGQGGVIINTSSTSGLNGNFGQTNYGAAKAGIWGFSRCLAIEGQKAGIRVYILAPVALTRLTEDLAGMGEMKWDMAGAGVVIGLMRLFAARHAKVNAVGIVGLVENMPSGTAQRPGDIVRSMSGQTIEVLNTDAEGRLVLADGIAYVRQQGARAIVDVATLTGAIYVTTPDYIALPFTTGAGNIILAVSGFWMLMGILVMRKMINFDF